MLGLGGHALRQWRWQLLHLLAPRRRMVHTRGLQLTLPADNWMTHFRWHTYNTKEPDTLDWLDRALQPGEVFFDVGANIGLYSLYAALRHPQTRVVALEPEYANLHLLKDNITANGLTDRIDVYALALSDHMGISRLHLQDLTPGSAMHTESREPIERTRTDQQVVWREGVYACTLDELCRQIALSPHHLKIDVDGTEAEILAGAHDTLRSGTLRSVLIEMPEQPRDRARCQQCLGEAGWHCTQRSANGSTQNEIWMMEE